MDDPPDASRPISERLWHYIALGIALLAVAARAWMAWTTHATGEDALITLRYAENIAHGVGFVYNPGEHVLGTTTPLYTLLLALAVRLHLDALLVGKAVNILAEGVTCYLLARLLARPEIGQAVAGLFAALLYAVTSTPISVSISGMETGLVTCVGLAAIEAYVARRSRPLYILGALLFLLRIDGLLLFAILAVGLALQQRRVPWRDLGLALLITLPWIVFASLYFGSPVPTSLIAKVTVYGHGRGAIVGLHAIPAYNRAAFATQFSHSGFQWSLTLLFLCGAGTVLAATLRSVLAAHRPPPNAQRRATGAQTPNAAPQALTPNAGAQRPNAQRLSLPLLWLLIYYGTMLISQVPAFGWYFLPPWPLVMGLAALGGSRLLSLLPQTYPDVLKRRAWLPALLAFGLIGMLHLRSIRRDVAEAQEREDNLRKPLGLWLQAHVRPDERIFLEPIGYVGYYSQRRILDAIGLISPEVLPSYRTPDPLADIVRRLRPEWLCLRPNEAAQLAPQASLPPGRETIAQTVLNGQYLLVKRFQPSTAETAFLIYHRQERKTREGNLGETIDNNAHIQE